MSLSPDAVVQVLLRGRLRLVAVATAVLRDPHAADDVFQQVVLSALQHRDEFHDEAHVLPWAVRAARFRAVDAARRRRLRVVPAAVLDHLEARWADPDGPDPGDRVRAVQRCLGRLGGPARDLLRWRYDDGLTAAAMAGRLRRSVDAVYQSLSRLHRALRACVQRELAVGGAGP